MYCYNYQDTFNVFLHTVLFFSSYDFKKFYVYDFHFGHQQIYSPSGLWKGSQGEEEWNDKLKCQQYLYVCGNYGN